MIRKELTVAKILPHQKIKDRAFLIVPVLLTKNLFDSTLAVFLRLLTDIKHMIGPQFWLKNFAADL